MNKLYLVIISFYFFALLFKPKKKIRVKEPKNGKRISYEEYEKEIKTAKKRVFGN